MGGDVNEKATPFVYFPYETEEGVRDQAVVAQHPYPFLIGYVLLPKTVFYSWAAQCGIPALLLERGGQECGQNGRLKHIRKMCWN